MMMIIIIAVVVDGIIICMYISCVGLCVHVFMNPMPS